MRISILIPAFNEEKLLGQCLRRVRMAAQAFIDAGWACEVIVCDNNSNDRTAEVARAEGAQVVFESFNQISRARNRAAAAATGDWFIFIDADSFPSRELFEDVIEAIRSGRYVSGGALVRLDAARGWVLQATRLWNYLSRRNRWAAGSFVFCEAQIFRQLGGFSQALYASEELDFSRRLHGLAGRHRMVILEAHPLVTSARKAGLCSVREYLWLLLRIVSSRGRALRCREACSIWYDGRR